MPDDAILESYREQRRKALEAIRRVDEGGVRHFDYVDGKEKEVTEEWRQTHQRVIDLMDRLIPAWEKLST